jgi:hypothetical protein
LVAEKLSHKYVNRIAEHTVDGKSLLRAKMGLDSGLTLEMPSLVLV